MYALYIRTCVHAQVHAYDLFVCMYLCAFVRSYYILTYAHTNLCGCVLYTYVRTYVCTSYICILYMCTLYIRMYLRMYVHTYAPMYVHVGNCLMLFLMGL